MDQLPEALVREFLQMSSDLDILLQMAKENDKLFSCILCIQGYLRLNKYLDAKLVSKLKESKILADKIEKLRSDIIDEKVRLKAKDIMYNVEFAQQFYADFEKHIKAYENVN